MQKHLLKSRPHARAGALAILALLLASAPSPAQTTAYCATGLAGSCGSNDITALTIRGTTLDATGLACTTTGGQAYAVYPAAGNRTATLARGTTYTLTTTLSGASIVSVWIDYDHNFVFDASEWTPVATNSPANSPVSAQLTVPATAALGQTSLRIRSRTPGSTNGATEACTPFFSGETKDFTVTIGPAATCPIVSAVSVTNVTPTGATVNFTPATGAGSYTVSVTAAGGNPITQTVTTSPATLIGLTASTSYTVSIVTNCGGTNGSSMAYTLPFTTSCAAPPYATVNNTTPYAQDFEAAWLSQCGTNDAPGANWRNTPISGDNSWRRDDDGASAAWTSTLGTYTPASSPIAGATGTHSARFHSYDTPRRDTGLLDLYLNMAGVAGTPTLRFDHINTSGVDSLKVYVSTNGGTTFTAAPLAAFITATTWTRRLVTLPTGLTATTIIRLRANSDFGFTDIGIDNVVVAYPPCLPVSGLTATNVSSNGAQLGFTPPAGAPAGTTYEIEYGVQGFTQGTGTLITGLTSATYFLNNLTQNTPYCFYVRQNCGPANGTSSYAGPQCFTTSLPSNNEPCGAVALGTNPISGTTAGATTSIQTGLVLPTCSGAQLPKDVWFSFTASAASMPLTITGSAAGVVQVYSSPNCSAGPFTQVFCKAGPGNNQNVGPVTVAGLTPGSRYYLSVSGYGSSDATGTFTIGGLATGTSAPAGTDALLVYPNPSNTGQLTLRLSSPASAGQATLLNPLGQAVATKSLSGLPEQTLVTRGLPPGLYTLRVTVAGQVLTRKIVLE